MSEVSTSRRDVMRALSIIPAVIAAPAVISAAAAATFPSSAAWDAAMARYLAAKARSEEMEARLKPIWDRIDAARPAYKITHVAKDGSSATYRMGPDDFPLYLYDLEPGTLDGTSFLRPQVEAMKAQHEDFERLKREVGYTELARLSDQYGTEELDAEYTLLNMPAPHLLADI